MNDIIRFATEDQAVLFNAVIRGQLSDGFWENSRPYGHYKLWCNATVEVGKQPGRNFIPDKDNYNLADKELLDVVGQRMINYVKLARRFGSNKVKVLDYFLDLDGNFRGAPTYSGDFWDEIRAKLALEDAAAVKACVEEDSYTLRDLRKDLREMSAAFKTWVKMG